jgi:hypothetical protein
MGGSNQSSATMTSGSLSQSPDLGVISSVYTQSLHAELLEALGKFEDVDRWCMGAS